MKLSVILVVFYTYIIDVKFSTLAEDCHKGSAVVHESLSTKTPYRFIANTDEFPAAYPGCTPIKFWAIIRHGTRNPSEKIIEDMNEKLPVLRDEIVKSHKEGKGSLCATVIRQLSKWAPQLEEREEKRLTHEGEDELLELGERFQKRFPELLPEIYSNTSYKFQFTATQRAELSARSFAMGLFGRMVSNHVWFPKAIYRDPVLRFYKLCDYWRKNVDKNPEAYKEQHSFEEGQEMAQVLDNVTKRLGLNERIILGDVNLIYLTCAFETAWFARRSSPWCSLLSDDDFKVLEYYEDLEYYWIDGYGHEINYKQACPTIQDMFSYFSSPDSNPKAVLYFSHAGTLMKMLAHLGLYRDSEPLLASNFQLMLQNRQWKMSRISAFASNIAFVLYRCGEENSTQHKILTLHQERPTHLPGCPSNDDLCGLDDFREAFAKSINKCDFQDMCSLKV